MTQPANISLDVISALKQIQQNIYIPEQVYTEYTKHYHKICSDEKKKYRKVTKELSDFIRNLQKDVNIDFLESDKVKEFIDLLKSQENIGENNCTPSGLTKIHQRTSFFLLFPHNALLFFYTYISGAKNARL